MNQGLKRLVKLLLTVGTLVMLFCLPASAATKTSVKTLNVGESYTIKNTSKVTSSKTSVAKTKKKSSTRYKVTALKKGKSTLTVKDKDGKTTEKVYLLVTNKKSFVYDNATIALAKGKTKTVKASTNFSSGVTIKYSSSDTKVAKVSSGGKITAVAPGTAKIKAKFYSKGKCVSTIKKSVKVYTSSYDTSDLSLTEGDTKTVAAKVSSGCTAKYSSSKTSVAKVDSKGKITAVKAGSATITAKVYYGNTLAKTYTKKVTVKAASASSSDTVTVGGVTFDMTNCPKTVTVKDKDMGCLSVIPLSTINPADITYKIANGDAQLICDGTNLTNLTDSDTAQYKHEYYVSDWDNMTAYVCTEYDSHMYLQYRCEIYAQLKTGSFPVSIYYKGNLIRTSTVNVTETSSNAKSWRSWVDNIEAKAWKSGMSQKEKLSAICSYVYENYSYYDDVVLCNDGAAALLYAARDMGLPARYYFVKTGKERYYHLGMAANGGHVCTIITIDGKDCRYETQGHY